MVSKRRLHHYWRLLVKTKIWQLALFFVVSLLMSAWALRQNSLRLGPLVEAVAVADREGGDVDGALRDLANYVTNHMNTRLSAPVQLPYTYQRAVDKLVEEARVQVNGDIYKEAQAVCEDPNILLVARAACIQDYVTKNAAPGKEPQDIKFPDTAIYTYSFASPLWSPDLAGWLTLVSVILFSVLVFRLVAVPIVKNFLKKHK